MSRLSDNIALARKRGIQVEGDYLVLWHGTSPANFRAIMRSGKLRMGTWFAQDRETARRYGLMHIRRGEPVASMYVVRADAVLPSGDYWTLQCDAVARGASGRYDPVARVMEHLEPFERLHLADGRRCAEQKSDLLGIELFHGTAKERWTPDFMDYLFVTDNFDFARNMAEQWLDSGRTPMVVGVDVRDIMNREWVVDDDDGRYPYKTWQDSFCGIGCFCVVGKLDIGRMPVVDTYPFKK